jgi:localization factor PodJL
MNKAMAWTLGSVEPRARRAAEYAAHRAGMSLGDWLNEAIVERAGATNDEDLSLLDPFDWPRESLERFPSNRQWRQGSERTRETCAEDLFEATIERIERRIALSEQSVRRAFQSMAVALKRTRTGGERSGSTEPPQQPDVTEAIFPVAAPSAKARDSRSSSAYPNRFAPARPSEMPAQHLAGALNAPLEPAPEKRRLDLNAAVSQIALRRQQLDARETLTPSASPQRDSLTLSHPPAGASEALREDIRALAGKLDELRRQQAEQRASAADVQAMRAEIAAMTHSLADLAPRNAVVALEGAVRDLTERVALLRQSGHAEQLLAPLDAMAGELRATLKARDPQTVAAGLEREIGTIGAKIERLIETSINPEAFEHIRRQTEEVRNLLAAAAMRTPPLERLERQIGDLADRVERLGASPAPHIESAQLASCLAEVRREIERSTPLSTLASIERRLEEIATKLDQAIGRPVQATIDARPFEDLAEQIEDVRRSVESRTQSQLDTSRLEASLEELNAKLEGANPEPLTEFMRDINAQRDAEAQRIEPLLAGIVQKLDRLPQQAALSSAIDLSGIEKALQSLNAKIELGGASKVDREIIEQVADELARRLEIHEPKQVAAEVLAEHIVKVHSRLDALSTEPRQSSETIVRDLLQRLQSLPSSGTTAPAGLAADLAQMRAEQANGDRRTQARLGGVQDILEKLVAQLANIEGEISINPEVSGYPGGSARTPPRVEALDSDSDAVRRAINSEPSGAENDSLLPPNVDGFLLEPGAGAPQMAREARELAQVIGSKTNPAVSAHIAAARRAAQAALAEGAAARTTTSSPGSGLALHGVGQARTLYANHRRSVLLAVALAIVATVAVRFVGVHAPFLQKSETNAGPVKAAGVTGIEAPREKPRDVPSAIAAIPRSVDTTPTASIAPTGDPGKASSAERPAPPDLLAAIPTGLPQALRDAVTAGAPDAQYEFALRLFEGRGLPQDQQKAAHWFELAAAGGLAPAQFRLGSLYEKGVGVARDATEAKRWYLKAAEAGNARAAHNLAVMYAEPIADKPDYIEAIKWFRKAGELGVRDSQFNLAVLYARGLGVEQDLRQSWLWFSLAAAQGDAEAGKKRDEVAARMDPPALAAAADALAKFKVAKPDPAANEVGAPPGGWDAKPAPSPFGQSVPAPGPGSHPQTAL